VGASLEGQLLKRIRAFAHVDDELRATGYRQLLSSDTPYANLSLAEQRLARMLFFSAFPGANGFTTYDDGLAAIRTEPAAAAELGSVIDLAFSETRHDALPLTESLGNVPLRVHASYQREEILSALDYANLQRRASHRHHLGTPARHAVNLLRERHIGGILSATHVTVSPPATRKSDSALGASQPMRSTPRSDQSSQHGSVNGVPPASRMAVATTSVPSDR
jgi:hypothetical protein